MNWFFNRFLKSGPWVNHLLKAYFTILFPQFQNNKSYHTSCWYNRFDGFYYNAMGLRYDSISKVYVDLLANQYYFDENKQTYCNNQNITFDKSGLRYSPDKWLAMDFLGNHFYWCPITNNYLYSGFCSSGLKDNRLIKASSQPLTGPSMAARIFLLKNDPLQLPFFKGGVITLVISSFIMINPIRDVSMIDQQPPKWEQTLVPTQFRFRNVETVEQPKTSKTPWLNKRLSKKQTRVSANLVKSTFDFNSPAATISVNSFINRSQYNTVNLLQDLRKCLDVHTENFFVDKQKQNISVNSDLKIGIQKVYKQLDIATNIAKENQNRSKQAKTATFPKGSESVERIYESIKKTAFDKNEEPIKGKKFELTVAKRLQEHSDFSLYGIKTLVAIKNDPKAELTKKEKTLIRQKFAITPDGEEIKALKTQRAHILSMSWRMKPRQRNKTKVLSLKLPFQRFPASVIDCPANLVTTANFLEKLLDDFKKVEIGVLPTIIQTKYDQVWTPEKNYLIANAIYDDFYMPALSENEKKYALEIRKQVRKPKENKIAKTETCKI